MESIEEAFGDEMDLYEILGVKKEEICKHPREYDTEIDEAKLRKAFYRKALKYHPDKNPGQNEDCTRKFQAINLTYQILSDATKRCHYHETGEVYDNDDADDMDCGDQQNLWKEYFDSMFGKVTTNDIDTFAQKYKCSEEEQKDVCQQYIQQKGNLHKMIEYVMLSEPHDAQRWVQDYILPAISNGDLSNDYRSTLDKTLKQLQKKLQKNKTKTQEHKKAATKATKTAARETRARPTKTAKSSSKSRKTSKKTVPVEEDDQDATDTDETEEAEDAMKHDDDDDDDDDDIQVEEEEEQEEAVLDDATSDQTGETGETTESDDEEEIESKASPLSNRRRTTTTKKKKNTKTFQKEKVKPVKAKPTQTKKSKKKKKTAANSMKDLVAQIQGRRGGSDNFFDKLSAKYGGTMEEDDPLQDDEFEKIQTKLKNHAQTNNKKKINSNNNPSRHKKSRQR